MTDLDRLFQATFDELESPAAGAIFPGFPGNGEGSGKEQTIDINGISRLSRLSRPENRSLGSDHLFAGGKHDVSDVGDRAKSVPFKTPGNPGNPGKGEESLAETGTYFFPLEEEKTGNPGKDGHLSAGHFPNPNRAAPQRSDWWTGPAMADFEPLPISPSAVRAGVERELRALAEDGREGPDALRDAVEITRAKIRNSEALAERQAHTGQCHVCDAALDDAAPVVAVLSGRRGSHLFMHAACCGAYGARRSALVDSIMAAAGYGAEVGERSRCTSL